jgi:hypothetical protein
MLNKKQNWGIKNYGGEGGIGIYAVSTMVAFGGVCFGTLVNYLTIFSLRDCKALQFNGLAVLPYRLNRRKW